MALLSKVRTATYSFGGNTINLQASFANLNKLREQTGRDPLTFLTEGLDASDLDGLVNSICTIFHCLQAGTEYEQGEIYDAFFGDLTAFAKPENLEDVGTAIATVLGADLQAAIAKMNPPAEHDAAPKNTSSTA